VAIGRRQGYIAALSKEAQFADTTPVRRHRPDYMIVLYMGLLMLLGLIIMYAIGPQRANVLNNAYGGDYGDTYFFSKPVNLAFGIKIAGFASAASSRMVVAPARAITTSAAPSSEAISFDIKA